MKTGIIIIEHGSNSKIKSLLAQFSLNQLIDTLTHFNEHSSSLIDLFMTNNVNYVLTLLEEIRESQSTSD
jgi:hypothetical protein